MAFCMRCGSLHAFGSLFCGRCGCPVPPGTWNAEQNPANPAADPAAGPMNGAAPAGNVPPSDESSGVNFAAVGKKIARKLKEKSSEDDDDLEDEELEDEDLEDEEDSLAAEDDDDDDDEEDCDDDDDGGDDDDEEGGVFGLIGSLFDKSQSKRLTRS